MHYEARTFGKNGSITMEPKQPEYLNVIGHATEASEQDWEKVRRIYDCPKREADKTHAQKAARKLVYFFFAKIPGSEYFLIFRKMRRQKGQLRDLCIEMQNVQSGGRILPENVHDMR